MKDHKFERKYDRRKVLEDEKNRIIDLMDFQQEPPTVGIYDEPVRYFKANLQWCKFIFGWLTWMQDVSFWAAAVDSRYHAIQQMLIFEEGIPAPTLPNEGDCLSYAPSASFIAYFPQNPYNNPDYVPPDYLVPPFLLNDELEYPEIMGYQASDVFVPFAAINIDPIDLISFNLPRLEISVKGAGQVELDFLAVSFGGLLVIKVGEMPNIADIILDNVIDTGIQIIDLEMPPTTIIHAGNILRKTEIDIVAEPEETTIIYAVFCPKLNDAIIPVAFGGGFRALQLCGFEGTAATMVYEDTRFNPETCSFEKRIDGVWSVIEGNEFWLECARELMATKQEIKEAIIESAEQIAARFLSGDANFENGLCIDDEGNIVVGGGGTTDDPTTPSLNEEFAARTGGVREALLGLQRILTDMFNWYASYTPPSTGVIEQMAADRLVNMYQFAADDAVTFANYWYTVYQNASLEVTLIGTTLDALFFCRGLTKQTFAYYIYNVHATAAERPVLEVFLETLNWQQIEDWYNRGLGVPSQAYYAYSCVPILPETVELDMSTAEHPAISSVQNLKPNHRYKWHVEGQFTDPDSPTIIKDYFYSHDTSTGVKTLENTNPFNSAGIANITASQVPWREDGIYDVIMDKTGGAGVCNFQRTNTPFNLPNVTGVITITMEDLGEFTV